MAILEDTTKIGCVLDTPCPDCGGELTLRSYNGHGVFLCRCGANLRSDRWGRPRGIPVDIDGRRMRVELHNIMDPYWKEADMDWEEKKRYNQALRRYLGVFIDMKELHVAWLTKEQLPRAIEIAQKVLPLFPHEEYIQERRQICKNSK